MFLSLRSFGYEQDVEHGNTAQLGDCNGKDEPFTNLILLCALQSRIQIALIRRIPSFNLNFFFHGLSNIADDENNM